MNFPDEEPLSWSRPMAAQVRGNLGYISSASFIRTGLSHETTTNGMSGTRRSLKTLKAFRTLSSTTSWSR